jgi:hypothetical protein
MDALRSVYSAWYKNQWMLLLKTAKGFTPGTVDAITRDKIQVIINQFFSKTTELLFSSLTIEEKKKIMLRMGIDFGAMYKIKHPQHCKTFDDVMDTSLHRYIPKEKFEQKATTLFNGSFAFYSKKIAAILQKQKNAVTISEIRYHEEKYRKTLSYVQSSDLPRNIKDELIKNSREYFSTLHKTDGFLENDDDFLESDPAEKERVLNSPYVRNIPSAALPAAAQVPAAAGGSSLDIYYEEKSGSKKSERHNTHNDEVSVYYTRLNLIHPRMDNKDYHELAEFLKDIAEDHILLDEEKKAMLAKIDSEDFQFGISLVKEKAAVDLLLNLYEYKNDETKIYHNPLNKIKPPKKPHLSVDKLSTNIRGNIYYQKLFDLHFERRQTFDEDLEAGIDAQITALRKEISGAVKDIEERDILLALDFEQIVIDSLIVT